jgi:hypothetical protein
MGSVCFVLFMMVCILFYIMFGNPFSGVEMPQEVKEVKSRRESAKSNENKTEGEK